MCILYCTVSMKESPHYMCILYRTVGMKESPHYMTCAYCTVHVGMKESPHYMCIPAVLYRQYEVVCTPFGAFLDLLKNYPLLSSYSLFID